MYSAKCTAICQTNCHFITFTRKAYDRINDRIYKKQVQIELAFLKNVSQLH